MSNSKIKSGWLSGLIITVIFAALTQTEVMDSVERLNYDYGVSASSKAPSSKVAVIKIDSESIENLGRWPWPRTTHAKMYEILKKAGVKTVGETTSFDERPDNKGFMAMREVKEAFEVSSLGNVGVFVDDLVYAMSDAEDEMVVTKNSAGLEALTRLNDKFEGSTLRYQVVEEAEGIQSMMQRLMVSLDGDIAVARSIREAGNIVLAMPVESGNGYGRPDVDLPHYVSKNKIPKRNITTSVSNKNIGPQQIVKTYPPFALLGKKADAIGVFNIAKDSDGSVRTMPLIMDYYGDYYPSIALLLSAKHLNMTGADIKVETGKSVSLGRLNIQTNPDLSMNIFYYSGYKGGSPFTVDSFFDVVEGKIPVQKYKGKIVLIGVTAQKIVNANATPVDDAMSPVMILANSISSILNENYFIKPEWSEYARYGAIALIALFIIFLVPCMSFLSATVASLLFLASLFTVNHLFFTVSSLWVPLAAPMLMLLCSYLFMTASKLFSSENAHHDILSAESDENNRMMGLSLQGQGQLDMAFEKFRNLTMDRSVLELLYNLALDFERKRQFSKAKSVYERMREYDNDFRDIASRSDRAENMDQTVILGGHSAKPSETIVFGGNGMKKPRLGRYEVEHEIGKGAMGAVYLGKDPAISRTVAIKTMALSEEFEGAELIEVKERFFREAETAGRLSHPNIVTMYDAGEEHDLAYIAMEYLSGVDLSKHIKPDTLLPIEMVMSIVMRCADALDCAHKSNVVHRDIKPANIMWDAETDTCKITDFGIARITDSSKTKTGVVLGTPSYMSPEQLVGEKVTGQSDLFSLGVMLFQMVIGLLPFRGDSMTALMYQIANEPHANPRQLNPEISRSVATIINRALEKDVTKRYATGADMVSDIKKSLAILRVENK